MAMADVPSSVRPLPDIYQVQFEERAFLGRGGFGDVYLGKRIDSGEPVAVKRIVLENTPRQDTLIERELRALNRIKHPNVVKLFDSNANGLFLYLYLEFCEHGDLKKYLRRHDQLNDLDILHLIQQSAEAVLFMHTMRPNPIIHRDLKPANFLITTQDGHAQLKVADFGLCRELGASGANISATGVGSQGYVAPEVVTEHGTDRPRYGKAADTFSLGIFFLSFINYTKDVGIVPIKVRNQPVGTWMHYLTRDGKPAYPPTTFSVHDASHITCLKALANQMIQQEPNDRISMNEVCNGISKIMSDLGIENPVRVEHSTLTDFGFVITKLASMDVGDIGENIRCGIGPFPGILVSNNANFALYRIRDDDQLELCWRKEIPRGCSVNSLIMSLDEDGQIYVQTDPNQIHVYDSSLQNTGTVAARGRQCHSLFAGFRLYLTCYVQPDGSQKVKFSLEHRDGRIVHTFSDREFSFSRDVLLGVAFDPIQGKTVLIDQQHRFCEIFDDAGCLQKRLALNYVPGHPTCFGEQIMVPVYNEARVEVYSWSGTWICRLDHQLGIPSDSKCRLFTLVSANKTILVEADPRGKFSLHAYRVENSPSISVLNSVDMTSME